MTELEITGERYETATSFTNSPPPAKPDRSSCEDGRHGTG